MSRRGSGRDDYASAPNVARLSTPFFPQMSRRRTLLGPGASPDYLPFFFGGVLIVSTTVVLGRRSASFTGMNSPVFASRPIFRVPMCSPLKRRRTHNGPLRVVRQRLRR